MSSSKNDLKSSVELFDNALEEKNDILSTTPSTQSTPSIAPSLPSSSHSKYANTSIADSVRIRSLQTQQSRLQSEAKIKSRYQSLKESTTPQPLSSLLSSSSPSIQTVNPYPFNFDQLNIIRRGASVYVSLLAGWFIMPNRIILSSYRDLFSVTLLLVCLDFCIQPMTLVYPLSSAFCTLFLKRFDEVIILLFIIYYLLF